MLGCPRPVPDGWESPVDGGKKDKEQVGQGDSPVFIRHLHRLPEAGAAGADIVIVGVICRVSVGIAGGDIQYAGVATSRASMPQKQPPAKQMLLLIRQTSP